MGHAVSDNIKGHMAATAGTDTTSRREVTAGKAVSSIHTGHCNRAVIRLGEGACSSQVASPPL